MLSVFIFNLLTLGKYYYKKVYIVCLCCPK
jgi:hypothetical protein